ncbi:MAG: hypothetical protein SFV55_01465 [Haliscomenobacter sp.]|uniref:AbaSI family restriction endonuclease n=1 Tax=Haliscomenobacter sp. TaxID=2717303 RepID=UPI0029B04E57|nr:hypothetical protein [Haliscomenobacter sp.]MDX2067058.1 hypothetical protein [Haliscomenobacter sp.]
MSTVIPNWKFDHYIAQLHRSLYKKHENFIINSFFQDPRLIELQPLTQHFVKRTDGEGKYALIDLYYPQIKVAIEIDEWHHNAEKDAKRQADIEGNIKASFERISIDADNTLQGDVILEKIEAIKQKLLDKMAAAQAAGTWEAWKAPKRKKFEDLTKTMTNTLFLKIRGVIKPEELDGRQRGYWPLNNKRRLKVDKVVVVHDGVIERVLHQIKWHLASDGKKWGYSGEDQLESDLLGTVVEGWNWQRTVRYSDDVY